jgi:tRNA pseudouridine38-40 synthase
LKEAVRQISGEDIEIVGASRTDGGAHALGQVAHLDPPSGVPIAKWPDVLNRVLPADVRVREARAVAPTFHSRFSAWDRAYVYRIAKSDRDPFLIRYAYGQRRKLDPVKMAEAARRLVGKHDFRAFTEELEPHIQNTVRELFSVRVSETRDTIDIHITGTAFLRGMMRRMAGCLYEIGRGSRPPNDVERLLDPEIRDQMNWPVVLPACGLTLLKVRYGRWPRDNRVPLERDNDLDNE